MLVCAFSYEQVRSPFMLNNNLTLLEQNFQTFLSIFVLFIKLCPNNTLDKTCTLILLAFSDVFLTISGSLVISSGAVYSFRYIFLFYLMTH